MANEFIIKNGFQSRGDSQVTGSLNVSSTLTVNGSEVGAAFPFTGDAKITGSLTVSGSFIPHGTGPTTNVVIGEGAAAVLGSGGGENIVIGKDAGAVLNGGDYNVLIGTDTGKALTSAYQNVVIGRRAGQVLHNSNAIYNVIIGADAGQGAGGAGHVKNVLVGFQAGYETDGEQNVYIGNASGRGVGGADADKGVAIGSTALYSIRDGHHNTAIGMSSLYTVQDGSDNIGLGYFAGYNIQDGSGNIIIGSGSLGTAAMSNQLRIGNSDTIAISASLATGDIILKNTTVTNLTASGNISSSIASTASLGQLNVSGEITVPRYIRRTDDADTYVEFLSNKLQLQAGGIPFITVDKDASSPYPLTINNGGNRINFRVVDENSDLLLKTNSEEFWAGLYFAGNQKLVTRTDGIGVTGNITASGHITASGNISSSGTFIGDGSTLTNLQRPITTANANFSASTANAGHYFRVGGNITCSIGTTSATSIAIGTEYEFFQTASAGNLLFETSSGVTFNSKDGNMKLTGQFSAATLKKVGTDEYDLIGDLG